jgi:4a-hydroxytetrahydrobiopterin dehydratase
MKNIFEEKENALEAHFSFKDFREAQLFINQVADLSEAQHHHPEIHWIYNRITLRLSTHDEGNIVTDKDKKLAEDIEKIGMKP